MTRDQTQLHTTTTTSSSSTSSSTMVYLDSPHLESLANSWTGRKLPGEGPASDSGHGAAITWQTGQYLLITGLVIQRVQGEAIMAMSLIKTWP